jgi:hypothetical protein
MTVTYTWVITHLSTTSTNDYTDIITGANWEVFGTDGTNTTSLTGTTPFALPNSGFIDYSELTEEQIVGWVKANLSELRLNAIENEITEKLAQLSYQPKPLPWNLPKPKKPASKSKAETVKEETPTEGV